MREVHIKRMGEKNRGRTERRGEEQREKKRRTERIREAERGGEDREKERLTGGKEDQRGGETCCKYGLRTKYIFTNDK